MDAAPTHSPPVVLIADDSEDVRQVLVMLLEEEGYACLTAVDGREALDLALGRHVDLILRDLGMPRLDGEAFCRAYRGDGGRAPVILITAARGNEVAAAIASCGAVDYVVKPFELDALLEAIGRHAGRSA